MAVASILVRKVLASDPRFQNLGEHFYDEAGRMQAIAELGDLLRNDDQLSKVVRDAFDQYLVRTKKERDKFDAEPSRIEDLFTLYVLLEQVLASISKRIDDPEIESRAGNLIGAQSTLMRLVASEKSDSVSDVMLKIAIWRMELSVSTSSPDTLQQPDDITMSALSDLFDLAPNTPKGF